jgi:hypothetical protein
VGFLDKAMIFVSAYHARPVLSPLGLGAFKLKAA